MKNAVNEEMKAVSALSLLLPQIISSHGLQIIFAAYRDPSMLNQDWDSIDPLERLETYVCFLHYLCNCSADGIFED